MQTNRMTGLAVLGVLGLFSTGCSPVSAVHWGIKLVGDAVDDQKMEEIGPALLGKPPTYADAMFGQRIDVLNDVNSDRTWLVYPVEGDLLDKHRYVVEVDRRKIVAVTETEKNASPKIDIPATLILRGKVVGKSPDDCEAILGEKRLLLTVRSQTTGLLHQIYDSTLVKLDGLTKPHYCQLKFDEHMDRFAAGRQGPREELCAGIL